MTTSFDAPIEILLLGPIEAALQGSSIALGGPRQRALLALLAMERGRVTPADRLIDELWAGEPPDGAETTLRSYVSRLRGALGDTAPIRASDDGYVLEIEPDRIDAVRFQGMVRDAERNVADRNPRLAASRLREGLALWRGKPFGGLAGEGALAAEAVRLDELRLRALDLRIVSDLALGAAGELTDELEALVRAHPYRETFWRHLMLALYRSDRQADALGAFHRARAALDEQLGIEPGEELQALEAAILRHEVPPVTPPEDRQNLPAPITSFIGREAALADVARLLATSRLVTLTGIGGVGKTRLAIEAARAALPEFPDGVVFVDLAPLADASLVAEHVSTVLEIRQQLGGPAFERLAAHLRPLHLLIVLDNCEHLREAVASLATSLLQACPRLRLLATSRELLGVPGETDEPVLPLQNSVDLEDPVALRASEAVRLFIARALAARPSLGDDDATIRTIARICSDLDGLPLGIELAAARARALSPTEMAERLRDRFQFLVSWRRLTPARHRTLREAMDWSYELLNPEEQRILRVLSVFSGGFSLTALAAVSTEGDTAGALEILERLIEASLVIADAAGEVTRYRVLETVRQYGAARLDEAGEAGAAGAARARHATYFASLAEDRVRTVERDGRLTPLVDLGVEDANLRAALNRLRSVDDGVDEELLLCASLWRYWWLRGQLAEGRQHIKAALERAGERISVARAEALRGASSLALRQGDIEAAVLLAKESVTVADTVGDVPLARAQLGLANAVSSAGDFTQAEKLYRASAARFREEGLEWDLGIALLNSADLAFATGDLAAVESAATESLAIFRRTGDDAGISVDLGNLGFVALERDDVDAAEALFREGLGRAGIVGFGEWISIMLDGLAAVATRRNQVQRAVRLIAAAGHLRGEFGATLDGIEGRIHADTLDALRDLLGREILDQELTRHQWISMAEAVALGLAGDPESPGSYHP